MIYYIPSQTCQGLIIVVGQEKLYERQRIKTPGAEVKVFATHADR